MRQTGHPSPRTGQACIPAALAALLLVLTLLLSPPAAAPARAAAAEHPFTITRKLVVLNTPTTDGGDYLPVSGYYPRFTAKGKGSGKLKKALRALNASVKEVMTDYGQRAAEYARTDADAGDLRNYYAFCEGLLVRNDAQVVSIRLTIHTFYGGAHDDLSYATWNYDVKRDRIITPGDLFTDTAALGDILMQRLQEDGAELTDAGAAEEAIDAQLASALREGRARTGIPGAEDGNPPLCFTVDPEGISFFFGHYDLGSYADGVRCVSLSAQDASLPIDGTLWNGARDFVTALDGGDPATELLGTRIPTLLLGDGQERLQIVQDVTLDESGLAGSLVTTLTLRGKNAVILQEGSVFSEDSYLARLGDTYYYLVQESIENDYQSLCLQVIRSDGTFGPQKRIDNLGFPRSGVQSADPASLRLVRRVNLLSSYNAWDTFALTKEGEVRSSSKKGLLHIIGMRDYPLILKKDHRFELANGKGRIRLKAGEKLTLCRTDGEHFVDLKTEKKKVIRVYLDEDHRIDGIDESELFDGLRYAG